MSTGGGVRGGGVRGSKNTAHAILSVCECVCVMGRCRGGVSVCVINQCCTFSGKHKKISK